MTDPAPAGTPVRGRPRRPSGLGIGPAALITIASVIVCVAATIALMSGDLSTLVAQLLAAAVLVSFGFAVYGSLRMVLVLIETAGERRRQAREVTERRKAQRPPPPE